MRRKLIINFGEYEFSNFKNAVEILEEEFGYEGLAWDMVVSSNDIEILSDFLNVDGIYTEIE